jgi:hypothetical protein
VLAGWGLAFEVRPSGLGHRSPGTVLTTVFPAPIAELGVQWERCRDKRDTSDVTREKPEPTAEQQAVEELVRRGQGAGSAADRAGGLLKQLTKTLLETALNQEMTEQLGHERNAGHHQRGPGRCGKGCCGQDRTDRGHRSGADRGVAGPGRLLRAGDRAHAATAADQGR